MMRASSLQIAGNELFGMAAKDSHHNVAHPIHRCLNDDFEQRHVMDGGSGIRRLQGAGIRATSSFAPGARFCTFR